MDEGALYELHPALVEVAIPFFRYCRWFYPEFTITSALRDSATQARLYAEWKAGRSPFPVAKPGTSAHEVGWAFDMARSGVPAITDPVLRQAGEVWKWLGGRYGGAKDPVHFQGPKYT